MSISVASVKAELDDYIVNNRDVITTGVYASDVALRKYCKQVSKVKGKFPQFHKIMSRVVQGYKPEWQALGDFTANAKVLQNFRQKVNLEIIVDEVYNTWLADLKIEGKKPEDQPISKVIIDELLAKVTDDISDLSVNAVYNAANADGQYGESLNGINKVVELAAANTDAPVYTIPLSAITSVNVLDEFKSFERTLPSKARKRVKRVFCSEDVALMYADAFVEKYGTHTNFQENRSSMTETYKLEIVGLDGLPDTTIFATTEGNMLELPDVIDNPPVITDTQVQDYVLKIFMEFHIGYDFAINQLLFVADFGAVKKAGLNNAAQNALYYPSENLTV